MPIHVCVLVFAAIAPTQSGTSLDNFSFGLARATIRFESVVIYGWHVGVPCR